jgi:alcohol/geraniol dehydrogenase (NADP+)
LRALEVTEVRNIQAWAALTRGTMLSRCDFRLGDLEDDKVEIKVEHCGLCRSDLAVIESAWSASAYPVVAGHEIVGRVVALGAAAKGVRLGQRVGVGWYASSCGCCCSCLNGDQQLCDHRQPTIVGQFGGFADHVRVHWMWAIPVPDSLPAASVGPLMCGGLAVFFPFWLHNVRPTSRVAIVGIGGLGHLAIQFARAWGCEVTAISSTLDKAEDAVAFGAHHVMSLSDGDAEQVLPQSFDFMLVTTAGSPPVPRLLDMLSAKGQLHHVGISTEPAQYRIRPNLISRQRLISGSSTGSPSAATQMLEFAARHTILPRLERFPMTQINEAISRLREGKARYRIVLDADFS